MHTHSTMAAIIIFGGGTNNQTYRLFKEIFDGFPDGRRSIVGIPRVLSRDQAEKLVIAIDLNNRGLTPKAIKGFMSHPDTARVHETKYRHMVIKPGPEVAYSDEIDAGSVIAVDLQTIRARVDAAIEYDAVRRWGYDHEFFKSLPRHPTDIKAAMEKFVELRRAGEFDK